MSRIFVEDDDRSRRWGLPAPSFAFPALETRRHLPHQETKAEYQIKRSRSSIVQSFAPSTFPASPQYTDLHTGAPRIVSDGPSLARRNRCSAVSLKDKTILFNFIFSMIGDQLSLRSSFYSSWEKPRRTWTHTPRPHQKIHLKVRAKFPRFWNGGKKQSQKHLDQTSGASFGARIRFLGPSDHISIFAKTCAHPECHFFNGPRSRPCQAGCSGRYGNKNLNGLFWDIRGPARVSPTSNLWRTIDSPGWLQI